MLEKLLKYIDSKELFLPGNKILLAVSGGADSVLLTELFHKAGFDYGIAHCNFHLREEESDTDESFVKDLATKYNAVFYCVHFDTKEYAVEKGISIEMAARELRYKWFNKILEKESYDYIATAHHLDDETETFFINLIRGTGIAGLHGIASKKGKLIRPLLFVYKQDILDYCDENKIAYRTDSSNKSTEYVRNKIRHKIIPELKEINPSFLSNLHETIEYIKNTETIFNYYVNKKRSKIVKEKDDKAYISIPGLKRLKPLEAYLYEFLAPFNFNKTVVKEVLNSLDMISGKEFLSPTHRLIKDRNSLIITDRKEQSAISYQLSAVSYQINSETDKIDIPIKLNFTKSSYSKDTVISKDKLTATLDIAKLEFPLLLRQWRQGDYFYPFGMTKKKKLSRFLIDEKVSLPDKENIWLLCSGLKIIWVVGHRSDNRFRVTERTTELLTIKYIK